MPVLRMRAERTQYLENKKIDPNSQLVLGGNIEANCKLIFMFLAWVTH